MTVTQAIQRFYKERDDDIIAYYEDKFRPRPHYEEALRLKQRGLMTNDDIARLGDHFWQELCREFCMQNQDNGTSIESFWSQYNDLIKYRNYPLE